MSGVREVSAPVVKAPEMSRRRMLAWSGGLLGAWLLAPAWLSLDQALAKAAQGAAEGAGGAGAAGAAGGAGLTAKEWKAIGVVVDEIFPHSATAPSGTEAGVVEFLRRALGGRLPGWRRFSKAPRVRVVAEGGGYAHLVGHFRQAVRRLDELAREAGGKAYAELPAAERQGVTARFARGAKADVGYNVTGTPDVAAIPDAELFRLLRRHAIEGYFSDPAHGGNRNYAAWDAIGHTCHMNYPKHQKCGLPVLRASRPV